MATFTLAGESFDFLTSQKLTFAEGREFEKVTGFTYVDLVDNEKAQRSLVTTQALMWLSIRRVKPEVKFTDLDSLSWADTEWKADELDTEPDAEADADPSEGEDSQPSE